MTTMSLHRKKASHLSAQSPHQPPIGLLQVWATILLVTLTGTFSFADSTATIIYQLAGTKVSAEDAQILTTKLKNLLEQQQGTPYVNAAEWKGSLPAECTNRETAVLARKSTGVPGVQSIIWGNIGEIDSTYICSAYRLTSGTSGEIYEVFQEEIYGGLSDVLKYSIYNIAMKMTGQPDKVIARILPTPLPQPNIPETQTAVPSPTHGIGLLSIQVDDDDAKLFLDGSPIRSGNVTIRLPAGMHRITAKTDDNTKTEMVEVFDNEQTTLIVSLDDDQRNVRFFMGFDASWMIGNGIEFGPSHSVGLEIKKKHLIALDYYWGFPVFEAEIYGGGVNYLYTFNINDIFLARLGGGIGFWYEDCWAYTYESYDPYYGNYYDNNYWSAVYFGGPKVRLEVGNKYVFFTILDARLLIGPSGVKAMLNSGISFRL